MYQAVLFDLDGTLLDTAADLAAAAAAVCRACGWPRRTQGQIRAMVGGGIPDLVARLAPPETPPAQLEAALERFQAYYAKGCTDKTRPYDGIPALLQALSGAGVRLGVLSNKANPFTKTIVGHYFPGVFSAVRGSLPDAPAKPGAEAAAALIGILGADPKRALLVGDSDVDLHTARNAGIDACAVTWGFRSRAALTAAGAVRLADTPEELLKTVLSSRP